MRTVLGGCAVAVDGHGSATRLATSLLAELGARITPRDASASLLRITGRERDIPGMPRGVVELGTAFAAAALGALASASGSCATVHRSEIESWILMPRRLGALPGISAPPVRRPLLLEGGAVCCELNGPADEAKFATLRKSLPNRVTQNPERLASAAQEWGLCVTPYRSRRRPRARPVEIAVDGVAAAQHAASKSYQRPLADVVVVDLTTMWAGPLATHLLGSLGADVVKVEPECRPDGLRRWGIPARASVGCSDSPFFATLNTQKKLARLDLRVREDREAFERLVVGSDVLVESFTPRVLPNLGYPLEALRALQPSLLTASMRAYPAEDRSAWRGYGAGAHAASGLADVGGERYRTAAVAYPDPLAGLALFLATVSQIVGRRRGLVSRSSVSLLGAIAPLYSFQSTGRRRRSVDADETRPCDSDVLRLPRCPLTPETDTSARLDRGLPV